MLDWMNFSLAISKDNVLVVSDVNFWLLSSLKTCLFSLKNLLNFDQLLNIDALPFEK